MKGHMPLLRINWNIGVSGVYLRDMQYVQCLLQRGTIFDLVPKTIYATKLLRSCVILQVCHGVFSHTR